MAPNFKKKFYQKAQNFTGDFKSVEMIEKYHTQKGYLPKKFVKQMGNL
jgi:hypothetical protein